MKNYLLVLGVIFYTSSYSQNTIAPDTVLENTIWDYDTVFLEDNLYIPNTVILEIKPSTIVLSTGYYKINVQGSIQAIGNDNEMIRFTVSDSTGFADSSSIAGGWDGFIFNSTSASNDSSIFDYCILEYGKNIEDTSKGGFLYDYNFSKIRISNCIIQHNYSYNKGAALYFENASPEIFLMNFITIKLIGKVQVFT